MTPRSDRRSLAALARGARSLAVLGAALLLLLEVTLRLAGPYLPGTYRTGTLIENDPALGWRHIAGASAWTRTTEWIVRVDLNAEGRRGALARDAVTTGMTRALVLGGSFVEAIQVADPDTFAQRLAAELSATGAVAAIDAGVGGYGIDQDILSFERQAPAVRPALAILVFAVAHDVYQADAALSALRETTVRPHFELTDAGDLAFVAAPPPPQGDALRFGLARSAALATLKSALFPDLAPPGVRREQLRVLEPPSGEWERAWRIVELLLSRFAADARAAGAVPLAVVVPDGCQVHADLCGERAELASSTVAQRRLVAAAARIGLPLVDLLDTFRARAAAGERLYFRTDLHWNARGQALAAGMAGAAAAPLLGTRP